MNSFYTEDELKKLNLKSYGKNVLISKKCSIYSPETLEIASNVRIDDFCIISGNIKIGNYVHIGAFCALYGKFGIQIGNFCGISPRSSLFSATDDFSGDYMISPMVPEELVRVHGGKITMENYSQIGANSTVMPDITLKEGAVSGACSFINKNLEEWTINKGIPVRFYKNRSRNLKNLALQVEGGKYYA
ncbi:acyltransferase [bacterium]|nr:acyltransferase [bacterium]